MNKYLHRSSVLIASSEFSKNNNNNNYGIPYDVTGPNERKNNAIKLNYEPRTINDFSTRDSRLGFIRKVYSIFIAQMSTTAVITYFMMNFPNLTNIFHQNIQIFSIGSFVLSTLIVSLLVSTPNLRYTTPTNFILLGIHTILQSILVGSFASVYNPTSVYVGALHTLIALSSITLYSFQPNPKYDLTTFGYVLFTSLMTLLGGAILSIFVHIPLLNNLVSIGFAVVFALYILHDTQKIIGGTHIKNKFSSKEYILAALNLYQDTINFFIQILTILGEKKERQK
eukprot:gene8480-11463_t